MDSRAAIIATALLVAACDGALDLEAIASDCTPAPLHALPGEPHGIVLLNAYWFQEEAARAVRRGDAEAARVEEVLREAAALGVVIRTNGFNDDPAKTGDSAIQVGKLAYDEVALRGLDLVLARARVQGVKLILPLGNFWDDYGGARQYVTWAGLPEARTGDPRFFSERLVVEHYRAHLAMLLSRTNAYDGIRYGEHPAVLAWEILNEPRAAPLYRDRVALRAWVEEIAAHVKSLAPSHLVGTGEEGLDLELFARNTASPFVDYASIHLFPEKWGAPGPLAAMFGASFLDERLAVARAAGKPLVLGEFGLRNDGALGIGARRAVYRGWFECVRRGGGAAAGPWLFVHDDRPEEWDPHTFRWWDGTAPEDPANRYVDVVRAAVAKTLAP